MGVTVDAIKRESFLEQAKQDRQHAWFESLITRGVIDASCCLPDGATGAEVRDFILAAATSPKGNRVLLFKGLSISGDIDLKGSANLGYIGFEQCVIDGVLTLEGADLRALDLDGTTVRAVRGTRARIRGSVYLRWQFRAQEGVDLSGSWIEGSLTLRGADIGADNEDFCLKLRHATIGGTLYLGPKDRDEEEAREGRLSGQARLAGSIDLSGLHVKEFVDHEKAYDLIRGNSRHIILDGFEYERLGGLSPLSWDFRVNKWFCLQQNVWMSTRNRKLWPLLWPHSSPASGPSEPIPQFYPQPYEQLAKVLKAMGHDFDAKAVMYMKRNTQHHFNLLQGTGIRWKSWDALRRLCRLVAIPFRWLVILIYGKIAGYGYRMGALSATIILLVSVQIVGMRVAADARLIAPAQLSAMNSDWWLNCRDAGRQSFEGSRLLAVLGGVRRGGAELDQCLRTSARQPAGGDDTSLRFGDYPAFNATIFGIEAFFPMLDLGQTSHWMISDRTTPGRVLNRWTALYEILGWIATSLALAGLFARFNQRGSD